MTLLELELHGLGAEVRGDEKTVAALRADFALFEKSGGRAFMRLRIVREEPRRLSGPAWPWRGCRFRDEGPLRVVDYREGARLEYDLDREEGVLTSQSDDLLHELSYLCLLSRLGKGLDVLGLHRVHALGFTLQGKAGMVLLPSGGGKTTLALELLKKPAFSLLADDIPLVDGQGTIYPMPLRMSARGRPVGVPQRLLSGLRRRRHGPKTLIHPDFFSKRIASATRAAWIVAAYSSKGAAALRPAPVQKELFRDLVAGLGTPQVLELLWPRAPFLGDAAGLARLAWARRKTALGLAANCKTFRLDLGEDPAGAARLLQLALAPGLPVSESPATIAA